MKKDNFKPRRNNEKVEDVRLNKYISHNTKYSRREADKLIEDERVSIDGKVVKAMGTQVKEHDVVSIDSKAIKIEKNKIPTVIVYNKPKGELVTKNDPQGRKIIYDTLEHKYKHFLCVGRLDYASEGVLLLSDSVDIVNKLMHSNLQRIYKIKVNGPITKQMESAMQEGLHLEDASSGAHDKSTIRSMSFSAFDKYQIISNGEKFSKIKVAISEGKNRELRRFFAHFELDVMDLKRLDFGGISLNNLPTGKSRYLSREEYKNLRHFLDNEQLS